LFRKILYPTDFSDCAAKAQDYVKKLKDAGTEEVVHVIEDRGIVATGVAWPGEEMPLMYEY
jgi:hypothetical protein